VRQIDARIEQVIKATPEILQQLVPCSFAACLAGIAPDFFLEPGLNMWHFRRKRIKGGPVLPLWFALFWQRNDLPLTFLLFFHWEQANNDCTQSLPQGVSRSTWIHGDYFRSTQVDLTETLTLDQFYTDVSRRRETNTCMSPDGFRKRIKKVE
jgi:hypothetical protein